MSVRYGLRRGIGRTAWEDWPDRGNAHPVDGSQVLTEHGRVRPW